jgi:LSD1 subclass zinc finger protein
MCIMLLQGTDVSAGKHTACSTHQLCKEGHQVDSSCRTGIHIPHTSGSRLRCAFCTIKSHPASCSDLAARYASAQATTLLL